MRTSFRPSCTHPTFRLRHCRKNFHKLHAQHLHAQDALLSKRRVKAQEGPCFALQYKLIVCSAPTGFHQQRLAAEVRTSPKEAIQDISVQIRFLPKLALVRQKTLTLLPALHAPDQWLPVQGGTNRC